MHTPKQPLKNRFGLSEWSGAVGDLGTLLPLAFALCVFNGYPSARIFFLWGIAYLVTGWYFKVPISIQPLKAMAVIAIAMGFSPELLASTAFFYGIIFLALSWSGTLRWLGKWFSPSLVSGIQVGIGLILAHKAIELAISQGLFLGMVNSSMWLNVLILLSVLLILGYFQFYRKTPIILLLIFGGLAISFMSGSPARPEVSGGAAFAFTVPQFSFLLNSLVLLILPQIPLTIGNAVFAASDACHSFWQDRSERVNPSRLGFSISLNNIFIGLLGGFPVCHGAGGIAAHAQFGGKSGGTTMIMGSILILVAVVSPITGFLFLIPIPILAAMLLFDSGRMVALIQRLNQKIDLLIAIIVGILSFATKNLLIAVLVGFFIEQLYRLYQKNYARLRQAEE